MSLKEVEVKESYDSSEDDVVKEFYIPVLKETFNYDRIAGFFTSTSLIISMKGILGIIKNGGHIRLLVSPRLNAEDVKIMNDAMNQPDKYISDLMIKELDNNEGEIAKKYRELLGHLIATSTMEIKVAMMIDDSGKYVEPTESDSVFHMKIGIMKDTNNNVLTFSGSINETFNAWNNNVEEFKVFKSWTEGTNNYWRDDVKRFEMFWSGQKPKIKTIRLPDAVINKYIQIAKESDFESVKKYISKVESKQITIFDKLFWYQKEALNKWESCNREMLFCMATGTGKTLTALAAASKVVAEGKTIVVIATPQSALSRQWLSEIKKEKLDLGDIVICDSSNLSYKTTLEKKISELNIGLLNCLTIITTHATLCKKAFTEFISKRVKNDINKLLIGDEVHGLGSSVQQRGLLENYNYRIGLSATPKRWFDDEGSLKIEKYFGSNSYEFGIDKALMEINPLTGKTFLTKYNYYPITVMLNEEEENLYDVFSSKIKKLNIMSQQNEELKEKKEKLLLKRAEILKSSENKIEVINELLYKLKEKGKVENTIIFTSPKHIKNVIEVLTNHNIICSPLTEKQGNKPDEKYSGLSERQYIIEQFKKRNIQVIVAIKCMDEGIDIPSADTAILMSSTTNPREYIQRIGRVIRRYQGKEHADIYDFVVKANDYDINEIIKQNELRRERYIAQYSNNSIDAIKLIYGD